MNKLTLLLLSLVCLVILPTVYSLNSVSLLDHQKVSPLEISTSRVNKITEVIEITFDKITREVVDSSVNVELNLTNLRVASNGYVICSSKTANNETESIKTDISLKDGDYKGELPCPKTPTEKQALKLFFVLFTHKNDIKQDFDIFGSVRIGDVKFSSRKRVNSLATFADQYYIDFDSNYFKAFISGPTTHASSMTFEIDGATLEPFDKESEKQDSIQCKVGNSEYVANLNKDKNVLSISGFDIDPCCVYPVVCKSLKLAAIEPAFLNNGAYYVIGDKGQFDVMFGNARHDTKNKPVNDDDERPNNLVYTILTVFTVLVAFALGFVLGRQCRPSTNYFNGDGNVQNSDANTYDSFA